VKQFADSSVSYTVQAVSDDAGNLVEGDILTTASGEPMHFEMLVGGSEDDAEMYCNEVLLQDLKAVYGNRELAPYTPPALPEVVVPVTPETPTETPAG
jgi:hypothetical protein